MVSAPTSLSLSLVMSFSLWLLVYKSCVFVQVGGSRRRYHINPIYRVYCTRLMFYECYLYMFPSLFYFSCEPKVHSTSTWWIRNDWEHSSFEMSGMLDLLLYVNYLDDLVIFTRNINKIKLIDLHFNWNCNQRVELDRVMIENPWWGNLHNSEVTN